MEERLDTASKWKAALDRRNRPDLYQWLAIGPFPSSLAEARAQELWRDLLQVYLEVELSPENLEFLEAVDDFKRQHSGGDAAAARVIYERFVKDNSPRQVNLGASDRNAVDAYFTPTGDAASPTIFDAYYYGITELIKNDTWRRFADEVPKVRKEMGAYEEDSAAAGDVYEDLESAPPQPDITSTKADKWNDAALKALREGETTSFWELGGSPYVIVIEAEKSDPPPYLTWARKYANESGKITMTAKGSIFAKVNDNRGKVTVSGATSLDGVAEAIGRFSQKEVLAG
jgi:hypothetical protein